MRSKMMRIVAMLLTFTMILSMSSTAFATDNAQLYDQNSYISEFEDGNIFIRTGKDKIIAIITNDVEHTIYASIMYAGDNDIVHQWVIENYPQESFAEDFGFWNDVIMYIEENMDEATLVRVWYEEAEENTPTMYSSAGADLYERLEELHGSEYSDKHIGMKMRDGHYLDLYETKEFVIRKAGSFSWEDGTSLASIAAGIGGLVLTNPTAVTICGILGIAFSGLGMFIPEGKVNNYTCVVQFTRYVRVDDESRKYAHAYKFIYYKGSEDDSLNSTGRADIYVDSKEEVYDGNQSEEYFTSGIYDSAYEQYTLEH